MTKAQQRKLERERRRVEREVNQVFRHAIQSVTDHYKRAQQVEEILAKGRDKDPIAYALYSLFVEISNEGNVDYGTPGVAGAFYRVAVEHARQIENPSWALTTALRHLDVLLNNPTPRIANKMAKFWDDRIDYAAENLPPKDPFAPKKRERRK